LSSSQKPAPELRVVACQMTSTDDWQANEKQILDLLGKIPDPQTVDLISFPENSLYLRLQENEKVEGIDLQNPIFDRLSHFARTNSVCIHLGSVPLKSNEARVYNSTVFIDSNGKREATYHKIHLFDVDISGHRAYRESDSVKSGERPAIFEIKGWRLGLTICYDLRFSNLFAYYARQNVDLILVPSAFTVPTGQAHWEVLLRARAIESQCYVVAAAQEGSHGGRRETFGHTLIVDPWGKIIAQLSKGQGIIEATLSQERLSQVRAQIPMMQHRKGPF
jgi:deaminated glutathione amidase